MDFLKEVFKLNEFAQPASEGIIAGDFCGFVDSGSYTLNALLSGSIWGGYPQNKITALAGPSGVGKTFFSLTAIKLFLDNNPEGGVFLFESESAMSQKMLEDLKIDTSRVYVFPVETVQQFRHQALVILNKYGEQKEEDRRPILMVLDSLGMLSTEKEINDIGEGKDTRDMTRAQLVKGAFRVLTLKMGKLGVPMILTNHTYKEMGLFPKTVMSGGTGLQYAASTVVILGKKQDKVSGEVLGNIIPCRLDKGRLTREKSMAETAIRYETGLLRWHGMVDFALDAGIWEKAGARIKMPDGSSPYVKAIYAEPEKYFTDDIMKKIDEYSRTKFMYGSAVHAEDNDGVEENQES